MVVQASDEAHDWAIIQSRMTSDNPMQTPMYNRQIVVSSTDSGTLEFTFQVHFVSVKSGDIAEDTESFWELVALTWQLILPLPWLT